MIPYVSTSVVLRIWHRYEEHDVMHVSHVIHFTHNTHVMHCTRTTHMSHTSYTSHTSRTSCALHTRHTHVSHVTHVTYKTHTRLTRHTRHTRHSRHTHVTHTSAHLFNQFPSRHCLQCSHDASLVCSLRLVREIDESCERDSDCEWGTVGSSCGNEEVCVCDATTNGATMRVENYGEMSYCYEFSQGQDCAVPEECLSK